MYLLRGETVVIFTENIRMSLQHTHYCSTVPFVRVKRHLENMAAGGSNISSTKSKNARQIPWSRSEYLSKAVCVNDEREVLQIKVKDKLTILLKSKRVFVVFRQKDGAVAVLKDVPFQKKCPSAMFDLCDHKGLEDAGMTLRYAVAKTDWSEPKEKVTLHKGDIILILANIHGHHVVGITQRNNVEVFPSKVVRYLTKPRLVLRDGMVIRMKSVHNNYTRKLFKSTGELFGWKGMDGQAVLLDSYRETEGHATTEDKYYYEWSEDDGYSVAWEEDDNQGNDDYRNDRPMGTVKGLNERPVPTQRSTSNEQIHFTEGAYSECKQNERPVPAQRSTSYEPIHLTEGAYSEENKRPVPTHRSTSYEPIHLTEGAYSELVEEVDHQPSENAEDGGDESLQSQIARYEHYSPMPALHHCIAEHLVDEKRDEFGKLLQVPKNLRLEIEERPGSVMDKTTNLLDLWHKRSGRGATVEVLVDALLKLHLEESTLLLKDMRDVLTIENPYSEA
ncbi:uncharacterized protein [Apostichopus japonicus]|uniref:uncharacterized protein isoform X3 n=1 Tax=Stichopus japonicus TaxID=307972 RepID=UPI003AB4B414